MGDYFSEERFIVTHLGDNNEYAGAVVPPVFLNSLHVFPSIDAYYATDPLDRQKYVYGRSGNPTVRLVEQKVAGIGAWGGSALFCFRYGGCVRSSHGVLQKRRTCYLRA